jgi:kynurenine formamidase
MTLRLKDISSSETICCFKKDSYIDSFFGSAVCLDLSHLHHTDTADIFEVKKSVRSNSQSISPGDIALVYTGHSDRFFDTSMWRSRRSLITVSALDYLAEIGIKNLCIDSPHIVSGLNFVHSDMALTFSLRNIGHLVNKRFIYFGFPLLVRERTCSLVRSAVLIPD